jgi:hypothetical protein
MTTKQIADRKTLYRRFRSLSDSEAARVIEFIDDLEGDEPNEETARILRESEAGINMIGPFHNMNDFLVPLLLLST